MSDIRAELAAMTAERDKLNIDVLEAHRRIDNLESDYIDMIADRDFFKKAYENMLDEYLKK